jgi:hypothetical protein
MSGPPPFDAAGRRRSPVATPGYPAGREPRNKGRTYPADPPSVDEIVAVMSQAAEDRHGLRARALIVVLWRPPRRAIESIQQVGRRLRRDRIDAPWSGFGYLLTRGSELAEPEFAGRARSGCVGRRDEADRV